MIELRVFGTADLSGLEPARADALLAQPKRLAMLVYLALAAPRGYHRRDHLVGMFWPELGQERARSALRRAVYDLRGIFDEKAVIATRGDEEIGLAAGAVWCDAVDFDDAVDAGKYLRALDLYRRGELLPGFSVPGAANFEDWLDRQRTALRDKAAVAAWGLAAINADGGQLTDANRYAKRASTYAPSDERMLRRVMLLLESHGDLAGALYVYDDFARRLRREFDAELSRESRELYDRLRRRDGRSGASA